MNVKEIYTIGTSQTCLIDNVFVATPDTPVAVSNVCNVWNDNTPGNDEIFFSGSHDDGETFSSAH